jgi:hypothetical protein
MGVEKLSISLDSDLVEAVRAAAAGGGTSVSQWLAEAAAARVRQQHLREALDAVAAEDGGFGPTEVDDLVAQARRGSRIVAGGADGA